MSGRGDGPKEGVYLDAALSAVAERVEERIDRLVDRRRHRTRALVATLAGTTLLGGGVTAAALTIGAGDPPPPSYHLESVRCVEGADDTGASYFAVRFELLDDDRGRIRAEELCRAARDRLAASPELASATPARLLALSEQLLAATSRPLADEPETEIDARALSASFGALADPSFTPPTLAVCGAGDSRTVLFDIGTSALCSRGESER
ncbi:hypothetical protein [Protaetiibacter intestinalis]|uniref:Uncharacterized protein n=1 Tax=Protaetiibacter intestinalis TaxID=2419774 RepID=A0A387B091_9MICO|nr:hypothetical protein [Protaetiibacter intestinalis]AYF96872.1 hypothetical protein D7I47_00465 [Protaetiibacter intestinalis]